MTQALEHYEQVLEDSPFDDEALTVVVVAGRGADVLAPTLGVDTSAAGKEWPDLQDATRSAYAVTGLDGGAVAVELSGYADPSLETIAELSRGGHRVAVVRDNIQAHLRFAAAVDGEVVFDCDDLLLVDEGTAPEELRPAIRLVQADPTEPAAGHVDPLAVALAMAEQVTGLRLTAGDLERAQASGFRPAPALVYP